MGLSINLVRIITFIATIADPKNNKALIMLFVTLLLILLITDMFGQYISWVSEGKLAWTLNQAGMGPDPVVNISARAIPQEPMVCNTLFIRTN